MSYLGQVELKSSDIRRIDVTGSTSATHTLTWVPPSEQSLIITINGIKQQNNYSISGTTLTLDDALLSADKMEVIGILDIGESTIPQDDSITNAMVKSDAAIALSKLATDPSNASNLASGTVPTARLGSGSASSSTFLRGDQTYAAVDTSGIVANQDDIALLAFKVAANGSLARYNLVDQSIDAFEDASGVDASASTGENRDAAGNYYSGAVATTGGTVTTDGGDTIHTFTDTGDTDFIVGAAGDVELLVVGGGGGAGGSRSGGGGAGGYRTDASFAVTATTYTVTVGGGGAGGDASPSTYGTDGGDSVFSTITSTGGGGGANGGPNTGRAGGSGGGAAAPGGPSGGASSPVTSPVQGYAGGSGSSADPSAPNYGAGGGGGSGGSGGNGTHTPQGTIAAGGVGTANSISGASVTYAAGGAGGNTANPSVTPGADGAANTGDGGAGSQDTDEAAGAGGAGGSGIVIIRYTTGDLDSYGDMTLISNAQTAQDGAPTTGDLVMTYSDGAGTAVANTDIKAYISRDGSAYTSAVTLASQGTTGGHTILTANGVDISGITSGTSMRWKIETLNQSVSKQTRIHAVSLGWS